MNIVEVKKLWMGENKFEYSKRAEKIALSFMCKKLDINPVNIILTEGYKPEYDARILDATYEVKFTSKRMLNVEYADGRNYPKGVFESTADYYLYISPGFSRVGETYERVGKVRLFKRSDIIKSTLDYIVMYRGGKIFAASTFGPECKVAVLDPKKVRHQWLGDIKIKSPLDTTDVTDTQFIFP